MTQSGYIVLNDYDKNRISDKEVGEKIRASLMHHIKNIIATTTLPEKIDSTDITDSKVSFSFKDRDDIVYTVIICTVNHLVNRNKILMKQNDIILPFIKDMDKYGTLYMRISSSGVSIRTMSIVQAFIDRLIKELNDPEKNNEFSYSDTFIYVPVIKEQEELKYEA